MKEYIKPNTNTDDNTENNTTEDGETLPDDGIDWDDPVWPK